jgi:hypothetical protein
MSKIASMASLEGVLAQLGFPEAQFEERERLLIIRLSECERHRLLKDHKLREQVLSEMHEFEYSRVVLEL